MPNNSQSPVLAGWQTRLIPGIEPAIAADAKYLSAAGMQKSELLYGLPQALAVTGPVVVMEGATDVWRYGPGAVALFGKSLSRTQELLLTHYFVGRPIVVMLDPDAAGEAVAVQKKLRQLRATLPGDNRVVLGQVPLGRDDPGACTRDELVNAVTTALSVSPLGGPNSFSRSTLSAGESR